MIKDYSKVVSEIRKSLKNYLLQSNLKSLVLGVSGGMDSALVAVLAKPVCDELNIPLIGRSISIHSNKQDEIDRESKRKKRHYNERVEFLEKPVLDKCQDSFRRENPLNGSMIINGGPGTGKTVALIQRITFLTSTELKKVRSDITDSEL